VQESEICRFFVGAPVAASSLEKLIGANEIGLDEVIWTIDRPVDMGFGCQVHDGCRFGRLQQLFERAAIANVQLREVVPGRVCNWFQ